jgi:hypothetical protein
MIKDVDVIQVQPLLQRLGELLTDEGLDFWTKSYQAKSIYEGAKAIIKLKPESNYKRASFKCIQHSLQKLPDEAIKLIDIDGTVDTDGYVVCPIKSNSVIELNRQDPGWRTAEPTSQIEFFMYEDLKPRHFLLYPVPKNELEIGLVYSYFPESIDKNSTELDMRLEYEDDIVNYCLWRAWQREGTEQKIISARQVFHEELGLAAKSDDERHPQDNRRRDERNRNR